MAIHGFGAPVKVDCADPPPHSFCGFKTESLSSIGDVIQDEATERTSKAKAPMFATLFPNIPPAR